MSHPDISDDTDLLSRRAEIFRSKLISDFHLLESISEGGRRVDAPRLYTHDILDETKKKSLLQNQSHMLVRFQVYTDKEIKMITANDRRKNRLKNRNSKRPSLDLWAHWIVHSTWFQNSILSLILINSVVLAIQAEVSRENNPTLSDVLDIFDYFALLVFILEIFIKWLDNFRDFWKNRWNVFDFLVTFLSVIPEIIKYSGGTSSSQSATSDLTVIAENLRTFRVLRSLKMVSRFQKVRLIVLAVTKAFQEMVFIVVLLFISLYIFAIIGIIFLDYSTASEPLMYTNSFASIGDAMITLIQLFTLDHWLDVYNDVTIVAGQMFAFGYVILWIIIGSFIFRNIFVGIMVNNFQSIRNDLFDEVEEQTQRNLQEQQIQEFANELERCSNRMSQSSLDINKPRSYARIAQKTTLNVENESNKRNESMRSMLAATRQPFQSGMDISDWQDMVQKNLETLSREEGLFCWPRDSLFQYFIMMETLQENLCERRELLALASEALLHIHDS